MQRRKGSSSIRVLAGALLLAALVPASLANDIQVGRVSVRARPGDPDTLRDIEFDVSWDNSWRADGPEPGDGHYRDAAWIFAKFRDATDDENEWQQAYLSTDEADHTPPAGGVFELGISHPLKVPRGVGVFLYSEDPQTGAVSYARARIAWDGPAFVAGNPLQVSVHAIEMVYVPEGAFWLGSGGSLESEFTDGSWTEGTSIVFKVESEDPITIGEEPGDLWTRGGTRIGAPGVDALPAEFPKGYSWFYCMKYPITQGQYADFLNHLDATQADARDPDKYGVDGFTISGTWRDFKAGAPNRACNWLNCTDLKAYLTWSGLRPMTELEYEKAARGPLFPVPEEFAWGTDVKWHITHFDRVDILSGEELSLRGSDATYTNEVLGGRIHANRQHHAGFPHPNHLGPGIPVRVGIFAAAAVEKEDVTRENVGASYWGIMELSGNVEDRVLNVQNHRDYYGHHGIGRILPDGTGDHDPDWDPAAGSRGGAYIWYRCNRTQTRLSDREDAVGTDAARKLFYGGRGVRGIEPDPEEEP